MKGYTLLEILIALFIFAIVSAIVLTGITTVISSRDHNQRHSEQLAHLQVGMTQIARDLQQMIDRPITNASGQIEAALVSNEKSPEQTLQFTRSGYVNPFAMQKRSHLQRVAYQLRGSALVRENWLVLDPADTTAPQERVLFNQVVLMQWQFLDHNNKFYDLWPPTAKAEFELPKAIALVLKIKNIGTLRRLFIIPEHSVDIDV